MTRTTTWTLLALGAAFAIACSGGEPQRSPAREPSSRATDVVPTSSRDQTPQARPEPVAQPRVILEPPGRDPIVVRAEVARGPAQTQRGLMFRREMDADSGMIFLFPRSRQMTFWMRNTFLPLDMIFITGEMRVLGVVENATPQTDDPREVPGVSQYVLEVNAGFAREHGIGPGTAVRFEDLGEVPPPAPPSEADGEWDED